MNVHCIALDRSMRIQKHGLDFLQSYRKSTYVIPYVLVVFSLPISAMCVYACLEDIHWEKIYFIYLICKGHPSLYGIFFFFFYWIEHVDKIWLIEFEYIRISVNRFFCMYQRMYGLHMGILSRSAVVMGRRLYVNQRFLRLSERCARNWIFRFFFVHFSFWLRVSLLNGVRKLCYLCCCSAAYMCSEVQFIFVYCKTSH